MRAIAISFQNFNLLRNEGTPAGLDNYRFIFGDDVFWNAIKVTAYYVVINMVVQTILALGIAVMMDRLTKSVFVRGILLLPWMLPNVLVGLLWLFMLDPTVGIVNESLGFFGIKPIAFLSNPDWVIPSLALINTWKFTGYTALLLLAGIQTIPRSLYEASALDGASEFTMFRTVTMPLLRPVLALVLVISVIGSFQVYDVVQAAAGGLGGNPGDPLNSSRVIYLYIYEKGFLGGGARFGQAAAAATVLMVGLLFITVFDAVGKTTFGAYKKLLKPGGIFSTELGRGMQNLFLPISTRFFGSQKVIFAFPRHDQRMIERFAAMLESGSFVPLLDRTYPLEEIAEAYEYVESGQKLGNVIIAT